MLIKSVGKVEKIIKSVDVFLNQFDNIVDFTIERSHGMGSYETFYIEIEFEQGDEDDFDNVLKIRFSGHNDKYSTSDIRLWNDDFNTVTELKNTLKVIIEKAKYINGFWNFKELQEVI